MSDDLTYENATPIPHVATVYACCKCSRKWDEERLARLCCVKYAVCQCGAQMPRWQMKCENCLDAALELQWVDKPLENWDGSFPIGSEKTSEMYWCADELADEIRDAMDCELDRDGEAIDLDAIECFCVMRRLSACDKENPPAFDVEEFLRDHLADGDGVDGAGEINAKVDAMIEAAGVGPTYWTNGGRIDPRDVAKAIGVEVDSE